ncbi:MAG: hypothetical protein WCI63_02490 [bacterium]
MAVRMLIRFPKNIEQELGPFFPQTQFVLSTFPASEHQNGKLIVEIGIRYRVRQAALDFLKLKLSQAQHIDAEPSVLPEDIQFFRNYVCDVKSKDLNHKY